jgi:hypothetical protein
MRYIEIEIYDSRYLLVVIDYIRPVADPAVGDTSNMPQRPIFDHECRPLTNFLDPPLLLGNKEV